MIELTIKTLDAQNHHFTVPNDYTVEQLKEHIAETIRIPSESQRCIYLGQMLQNDTKLSDCDVNGKVIHVVQRPPPSTAYPSNNSSANSNSSSTSTPGRRVETHTGTMYLGAMAFPPDLVDSGVGFAIPHSRAHTSTSRLTLGRNLLRRAINIISQLESENYFVAENRTNQSRESAAISELNAENSGGVGQPEVEIRIESPSLVEQTVDSAVDSLLEENIEMQDDPPSTSHGARDQPSAEEGASTDGQSQSDNLYREDIRRQRTTRTPVMATALGAVLHAQVRLIPFMQLLRQYLSQDTEFGPESNTTHTQQQIQTLFNSISELMHYFAHIYHAMSDIFCDFNQPPPRTLRCRPVIVQQQHATFARGVPRARAVIRTPVISLSRREASAAAAAAAAAAAGATNTTSGATATTSTSSASSDQTNAASMTSNGPTAPEAAAAAANADAIGTSSVEVVIGEADTTNLPDGNEDGSVESEGGTSNANGNNFPPNVTVRSRNGNTFFIHSMPGVVEGGMPEGIRINSVEATILTPNEDVAAALGGNPRWRGGILPAEVLHNLFGIVDQLRQGQRPSRDGTPDRTRSQSADNAPVGGGGAQTATASTNGQSSTNRSSSNTSTNNSPAGEMNGNSSAQPTNGPTRGNHGERSIGFDLASLTRTFDPFLPCHSHHIHSVIRPRSSSMRNSMTSQTPAGSSSSSSSTTTAAAAAAAAAAGQSQSAGDAQEQQTSTNNQTTRSQQPEGRNEYDSLPLGLDNISNFFHNMLPRFPGLNISNVMVRRGGATDTTNAATTTEDERNAQGQSSTRARIQVTSNFPSAIHIEIDPIAAGHHEPMAASADDPIETSSSDNNTTFRDERPRARRGRTRTASGRPRMDVAAANEQSSSSSSSSSPSSSSSSSSSSSLSSDEDLSETSGHEKKKAKKETSYVRSSGEEKIKDYFYLVQRAARRHRVNERKLEWWRKPITNETKTINFPLYKENQEALFTDLIKSAVNGTSFEQIIRGGEKNMERMMLAIRQRIRNYMNERRTTNEKENILNAVNILINNDVHKMKNLLNSDSFRDEIDLELTICKFNQDSVPELIEHVIKNEDSNSTEMKEFYQLFNFYVARLLALFVYCVVGENRESKCANIRKVLGAVVEELAKSIPNEDLICWLRNDMIKLVVYYSNMGYPSGLPRFMEQYVVYRLPPVITVATALTTSNSGPNAAQSAQQPQPMEVEQATQSASSSSSEASFVSASADESTTNAERLDEVDVATVASGESSTASPVRTVEAVPEVVLNAEEWHRSFPSDWVPIITRDIGRLRRQGSQPPFSDAYLSGMPTKRRKLLKSKKSEIEASEELITGNISSAINAAGFSARTNQNVASGTAGATLNEMAKEELKETVRETIVQQTDFLPHRFPDSAKYFMEK